MQTPVNSNSKGKKGVFGLGFVGWWWVGVLVLFWILGVSYPVPAWKNDSDRGSDQERTSRVSALTPLGAQYQGHKQRLVGAQTDIYR